MFGTPLVEKGYDQAAEWLEIVERLYASDEPFDHEGAYYKLKDAVSRPASLQQPRPVTMNAAFGGPGRDFASAKCDYLFTTFSEIAEAGSMSPTSASGPTSRAAASGSTRWRMSSAARRWRRRGPIMTATR